MKRFYSIFAVVALISAPLFASAATFKADDSVTINDALEDDLYVAGAMVNVTSPILGDVFIAGANINVSGEVSEDLFVVGSNVNLTGNIGDDLRVAGSNVTINGDIGGDVLAAGALVHLASGTIGGDLYASAGVIIIDGNISGDLVVNGAEVTINGSIAGDIIGDLEELNIAEGAVILGNVEYKSNLIAEIAEGASIIGEVLKTEVKESDDAVVVDMDVDEEKIMAVVGGVLGTLVFLKLIAALLVALFLALSIPKTTKGMVLSATKRPGAAFLRGLLLFIAGPVILGLLFITVVGIPVALVLIAMWMIIGVISLGLTGTLLGSWLFQVAKKQDAPVITWVSAVVGTLVMTLIIVVVPFIGWLAGAIVYLMTVGVALELIYKKYKELN
ncbi:polymer-forming cytoskeletal protein [Candidatus Uhrbacteria bacterium]|nr:polymer-forming cytoskeletal protein [Candidatus Uhrbacteria bacterium]